MAKQSLIAENISKSYKSNGDELKALDDVSFTIDQGKFVCLIGPNGCGKSTLLKIIAGIFAPTSGSFKVRGKVAYLPQEGSLMPWSSVFENLRLPAKIDKTNVEINDKKIRARLEEFDLSKFSDYYPAQLSGGMQQKVALLRTVIYRHDLIILDEPFSALDAITRRQMQDWTVRLWQKSRSSVLCVTHDINEATYLADEIYLLSKRPANVVEKFEVNIQRPRKVEDLSKNSSIKLQKKLQELLFDEES